MIRAEMMILYQSLAIQVMRAAYLLINSGSAPVFEARSLVWISFPSTESAAAASNMPISIAILTATLWTG